MDSALLIARIKDTAERAIKTEVPRYLGFLSEENAVLAADTLRHSDVKFCFGGGFPDAQRVYLACLPEWCEEAEYPISALTIRYNKAYTLTHRDFLGSVIALGIERDKIGDILIEDGRAVIFLSREITPFVKEQLSRVGRVGVTVEEGFSLPLPCVSIKKEFTDTVVSLRLDCVVASICSVSRNTAVELINDSRVILNSFTQQKSTVKVTNGDTISVRGKGKFEIVSADEFSKKGRIIIKYTKFL